MPKGFGDWKKFQKLNHGKMIGNKKSKNISG